MHTQKENPEKQDILKNIETLTKLAEIGKLETFEIDIIRSLVNRERNSETKNHQQQASSNISGKGITENLETQSNSKLNAIKLENDLLNGKLSYAILGTNGKEVGHHTQFASFKIPNKYWEQSTFDTPGNIPDNLKDDTSILFVRLLEKEFGEYKALSLRVADRRVDHRGLSHTTVILFIPKTIEKIALEELGKDTEGLKRVMNIALEKSKNPLRGAEKGVTKSFFI